MSTTGEPEPISSRHRFNGLTALVLPGKRPQRSASSGDTVQRVGLEHRLAQPLIITTRGERSCDDAYQARIAANAIADALVTA